MPILVTGAAGFIGSHVAHRLLDQGREVLGLDNLNPYYDPKLKEARLARLQARPGFRFAKVDLADRAAMQALFAEQRPELVIHLAAQAGVRYSLENPYAYADANLVGFLHILEGCRATGCRHLVYASTSSVYGLDRAMPFSEHRGGGHPMTLYAATKRANELMAHSYAHLFGLPCTGLRFFTVYGPWGRPDMALFKFTDAMLSGRPIELYNRGEMVRDFTYIDDIVEGVVRIADIPAQPNPSWNALQPDPASSSAPWRIYNIGNSQPVQLTAYVEALEEALGMKAERILLPMQPGDVPATEADVSELETVTGFRPRTSVREGVARFVAWYRAYYGR
ncbi:MAG: NAD-dependent epimerase [Planctomycetota bacterium]|nr:NAD-dependent epimerase [Planctomycetota bacterium]MDW8373848.1 NAD-dependent epimerase [Planctomycetota bacterium]